MELTEYLSTVQHVSSKSNTVYIEDLTLNKHVALLANIQYVPYTFRLYNTHVQTNNHIQQEAV
jgi:hypothetical protein